MEYSMHNPHAETLSPTIFDDEEALALFSKFAISTDDSFVPEKMEIRVSKSNGRKSIEDTRRIILLGKNRLQYKVFKYPALQPHLEEDIPMS